MKLSTSKRNSISKDSSNGEKPIILYSPLSLKPKEYTLGKIKDNTRRITEFEKLNKIGEGTYGIVNRARDLRSQEIVAIKKVRMERETSGLPISSVREINMLTTCNHRNIVNVLAIATEDLILDSIYLVMEYCEHDLSCLLDNMPSSFREADVKCLSVQLLQGIQYLHSRYIIHRDLKVSNILLTNTGLLKIADFGLARNSSDPPHAMTQEVVTLWYRAPELLLGSDVYTTSIDLWSVGCIIAELHQHSVLIPGNSEANQIELMVNLLGTPTEKIWEGFSNLPHASQLNWPQQPYSHIHKKFDFLTSPKGADLIGSFLVYDPKKRLSARSALNHPYFQENPLPTDIALLPTFPEHRNRNISEKRRKHQIKERYMNFNNNNVFG